MLWPAGLPTSAAAGPEETPQRASLLHENQAGEKIGDTLVTLEPRFDLTGRFFGYEVAANGRPLQDCGGLHRPERIFQEVVANLVQVNSNQLKNRSGFSPNVPLCDEALPGFVVKPAPGPVYRKILSQRRARATPPGAGSWAIFLNTAERWCFPMDMNTAIAEYCRHLELAGGEQS